MRFNDTEVRWRSFFAWRPVYIGNVLSKDGRAGKLGWCWLEWVERRRTDTYEGTASSIWVYRYPNTRIAGVAGKEWSD